MVSEQLSRTPGANSTVGPLPAAGPVPLAGSGAGYTARCPFHDDDDPSLSLFQGDQGWACKCHAGSCGARGPLSLLTGALGIVPPGVPGQAAGSVGAGLPPGMPWGGGGAGAALTPDPLSHLSVGEEG